MTSGSRRWRAGSPFAVQPIADDQYEYTFLKMSLIFPALQEWWKWSQLLLSGNLFNMWVLISCFLCKYAIWPLPSGFMSHPLLKNIHRLLSLSPPPQTTTTKHLNQTNLRALQLAACPSETVFWKSDVHILIVWDILVKDWIRKSDKSAFSVLSKTYLICLSFLNPGLLQSFKSNVELLSYSWANIFFISRGLSFHSLAQQQHRWAGFAETFQTNSPLCWGNYEKFPPQVDALEKEGRAQ